MVQFFDNFLNRKELFSPTGKVSSRSTFTVDAVIGAGFERDQVNSE